MLKDFHSNQKAVMATAAATLTSDPTPITVDLADARGVEFVIHVGVGGITFNATNRIEWHFDESDDDATYTEIAAEDMIGITPYADGVVKRIASAHASPAVYRFGYRGSKRYVQLTPFFPGTHGTGTALAAVAMIDGRTNPQDAQA